MTALEPPYKESTPGKKAGLHLREYTHSGRYAEISRSYDSGRRLHFGAMRQPCSKRRLSPKRTFANGSNGSEAEVDTMRFRRFITVGLGPSASL